MSDPPNQAIAVELTYPPSLSRQLHGLLHPPNSSGRINSPLSKVYEQASELYLTRRLPECLTLLEQSVFPEKYIDGNGDEDDVLETTLISDASRSLRVKVWNLYLTLLNSLVSLGATGGHSTIGNTKWRELAALVQSGVIWEQVVKVGYHGVAANVDADVVVNLSILLLTQCESQELNQDRLEAYLTRSENACLDISQEFGSSIPGHKSQGFTLGKHHTSRALRDLNSMVKIFELYVLHVLPRNNHWRYAEQLISHSNILDAETRETFLQILDGLESESQDWDSTQKVIAEPTKSEDNRGEPTNCNSVSNQRGPESIPIEFPDDKKENVENDYGIEDIPQSLVGAIANDVRKMPPLNRSKSSARNRGTTMRNNGIARGFVSRGNAMVFTVNRLLHIMSNSLSQQPMLFMRFAMFLIVIVLAFSRRNLRQKLKGLLEKGWEQLSRTAGMGMKVSYL